MTDPRPRPKYGEYAPLPPAAPKESTGSEDSVTAPSSAQNAAAPVVPPVPAASPNAHGQTATSADAASTPAATPVRKQRTWDVLLTSTLLFFGVVDVINTFSTVANLGPVLREGLAAQGVDSFTSDAIAIEAGGIANIVRVVVLVLTIVFSLIQIQRKRIAFWIPIVGGLLAGIALMVAVFVAVMSDPGFVSYVENLQ